MSVGLIVAVGVILLGFLGLTLLFLDRWQKRRQRMQREKEQTRREEAEAMETLFEDETVDPIDRELERDDE